MNILGRNKNRVFLKAVALVAACVFFIDTIAYAAPSLHAPTNLAVESKFKPFSDRFGSFSEKYGLDFQAFAMAAYAAGEIREKINSGVFIRKRDLQELNRELTKIGTRIGIEGGDFGERELKSSKDSQPRKYKYVTFYFGEEKERIEARFIKDHESLTEDERQELGVRNPKDIGYLASSGLPELEGVWFVEADRLQAGEITVPEALTSRREETILRLRAMREQKELSQEDVVFVDSLNTFFNAKPSTFVRGAHIIMVRYCIESLLFLVENFNQPNYDKPLSPEKALRFREIAATIENGHYIHEMSHWIRPLRFFSDIVSQMKEKDETVRSFWEEGNSHVLRFQIMKEVLSSYENHKSPGHNR